MTVCRLVVTCHFVLVDRCCVNVIGRLPAVPHHWWITLYCCPAIISLANILHCTSSRLCSEIISTLCKLNVVQRMCYFVVHYFNYSI